MRTRRLWVPGPVACCVPWSLRPPLPLLSLLLPLLLLPLSLPVLLLPQLPLLPRSLSLLPLVLLVLRLLVASGARPRVGRGPCAFFVTLVYVFRPLRSLLFAALA
jgi:hypothetical protein